MIVFIIVPNTIMNAKNVTIAQAYSVYVCVDTHAYVECVYVHTYVAFV